MLTLIDKSKLPPKKKKKFEPTKEQQDAIDHEGSDLLISAGAGSGKTATLTDRIIKRIVVDKVDISKMLVVTYTKDAANELKTRIADKLSAKLEKDPTNQRLISQFVNITSADISTIHSFCFKCVRPHLDSLGLDSDIAIGTDGELDLLRDEAMNEVIDEFYDKNTVDPDFLLAVDCYAKYSDDSTLANALLDLNTKLSSCADGIDMLLKKHTPGTEFFETPHGQALFRLVKRTVDHYLPLVSDFYNEALSDPENINFIPPFASLVSIYTELNDCLKTPSYMKTKAVLEGYRNPGLGRKRGLTPNFSSLGLATAIREAAHKEIASLRKEYFYSDNATIDAVFEQNEKICFAIHKILKAYKERYQEKKRKHALCDFDDLEKMALELFYDGDKISPIAREIKDSYTDIYIDEYQDVNSVQDKIFKAIMSGNRFMVGDIKQSIYGFRSAEPELFSHYRDTFLPYEKRVKGQGATIFMSDNFRCDPDVINLTNHMSDYMFENSFGFSYDKVGDKLKASKDHEEYDDNDNLKPFNPQKTELCLIDMEQVEASPDDNKAPLTGPEAQAEFVAQEIKRLLKFGKLPNGDKIEEKHIAILLKKFSSHVQKYIDALNKYGIKHEFVHETSFFEKPHVILLLNILNIIDNPSKDIYLAGAMHSCIWNFTMDELVKIKAGKNKYSSLYSALECYANSQEDTDDNTLKEKVALFVKELTKMREETKKMNAYEIVSYVMNKKAFISFCNSEQRQDAIKLYNMARCFEQGSYKGLYSFIRHLDDVSSKGIKETVTSDPDNSVKIVTMHKSKGLEYEVCFLCDLEKDYFRGIPEPPILFQRSIGICGYISRDGGVVKYDNLLRKCVSIAKRDEEKEEAMRLLYVAMTRARSKLYLTGVIKSRKDAMENEQLYDGMADPFILYSKTSHLNILLGARPYLHSFLDERPNVYNSIRDFDLNMDEKNNQKNELSSDEMKKILKERFDFSYKYAHLGDIPAKLSISSLHPVQKGDEDEGDEVVEIMKKPFSIDRLPTFNLNEKRPATGAERGTATHVFMQFCDFENLKKNGYENELKRLTDKHFITPSVAKLINLNRDDIEAFIYKPDSIINDFIKAKDNIIREFRFNLMLPANEFFENDKITTEKVLVQGVVDCLYQNEFGEYILVDYKTDRETDEREFIRKHKNQLNNYKRACEMMFRCKVSKVLIYSVYLRKTIEVK